MCVCVCVSEGARARIRADMESWPGVPRGRKLRVDVVELRTREHGVTGTSHSLTVAKEGPQAKVCVFQAKAGMPRSPEKRTAKSEVLAGRGLGRSPRTVVLTRRPCALGEAGAAVGGGWKPGRQERLLQALDTAPAPFRLHRSGRKRACSLYASDASSTGRSQPLPGRLREPGAGNTALPSGLRPSLLCFPFLQKTVGSSRCTPFSPQLSCQSS